MIRRLLKPPPQAFRYGTIVTVGDGKVEIRTGGDCRLWADDPGTLSVGDAVVVSGSAPRFVVQRVTDIIPRETAIELV